MTGPRPEHAPAQPNGGEHDAASDDACNARCKGAQTCGCAALGRRGRQPARLVPSHKDAYSDAPAEPVHVGDYQSKRGGHAAMHRSTVHNISALTQPHNTQRDAREPRREAHIHDTLLRHSPQPPLALLTAALPPAPAAAVRRKREA